MLTVVVMPCLNEAGCIMQTIASLGFNPGDPPPQDARLVIVDNGSTDGTMEVLAELREEMPETVHLKTEPRRGYVPPRRRGVQVADSIAASIGADPAEVLILQVDADTLYRQQYIETMRGAAADIRGVILEGSTKPPPSFVELHPDYVAAQRLVDDVVEPLDARDEDEVVLDDKVCGYRLSDYRAWGGLFEEHDSRGDPIHAETTRFFIRARLRHGARKVRVDPAGAMPSRRRIIEDPWLQYATVGFPRGASWIASRVERSTWSSDVDGFATGIMGGNEAEAVRLRMAHQLVLFRHLPALVGHVAGRVRLTDLPCDVRDVFNAIALPTRAQMAALPGGVVTTLLELIDTAPHLFPRPSRGGAWRGGPCHL